MLSLISSFRNGLKKKYCSLWHLLSHSSKSRNERNISELQPTQYRDVIDMHNSWVRDTALNEDGSVGIIASNDRTARVQYRSHQTTLAGHTNSVWGCTISADGTRAATASLDGTVRLWNLRDGRCISQIAAEDPALSEATHVTLTEDGRVVVAAFSRPGYNKTELMRLSWGASDALPLRCSRTLQCRILRVSISDSSDAIAFTTRYAGDRELRIIRLSTLRDIRNIPLTYGHWHADVSAATRAPAIAVSDGSVLNILHPTCSALDRSMPGYRGPCRPTPCAISADGSIVVSASGPKEFSVYHVKRCVLIATLATNDSYSMTCSISANVSTVVVGSFSGETMSYALGRVISVRQYLQRRKYCAPVDSMKLTTVHECAVDMVTLRPGDKIIRLPCGHLVHSYCARAQLRAGALPFCPIDWQHVSEKYVNLLPSWVWE